MHPRKKVYDGVDCRDFVVTLKILWNLQMIFFKFQEWYFQCVVL